ncbi:hypothetical protein EUTSA_v10026442mg [Eutrema salsugineum]|uniref:Uncharacterized protein n=1 Tax=Eutrema salsugineum TaxID=72664 RepID=V4MD28_EUTSA|nr:uncharacterized protein LOC18028791 [Eutrema salsugineum]XP_024005358.1 uncharacterized protein LOC18028791 [Eutrema salsugineum]ESQ53072.1 hypothetical protein EUTSA_v10026442mg [Eutrema salsugineum]
MDAGKSGPKDSKAESGDKKPQTCQSPASNAAASGRLVYVRRRVEVESGTNKPKEPTSSSSSPAADSESSPRPRAPTTTHCLDWEERYHHLQLLLNKLNESDQTDHLQMLWSLSSSELSKHAVELEKRSIQFSLEEAMEMQRVASLNVLGRSVNSLKSTSNE